MNYRIIPVTAFSQNCSLIWCEQTKLAALVDPGGDAEKIKQEVADSGVTPAVWADASAIVTSTAVISIPPPQAPSA